MIHKFSKSGQIRKKSGHTYVHIYMPIHLPTHRLARMPTHAYKHACTHTEHMPTHTPTHTKHMPARTHTHTHTHTHTMTSMFNTFLLMIKLSSKIVFITKKNQQLTDKHRSQINQVLDGCLHHWAITMPLFTTESQLVIQIYTNSSMWWSIF